MQPYAQPRALVEQLYLDGPPEVRVIDRFEDGPFSPQGEVSLAFRPVARRLSRR
jgi:hypothetical protein